MGTTTGEFVATLARERRVLVIGGLAVIAHGYNRPTKDADIWLEPMESPEIWAEALLGVCDRFPGLSIHTLPGWRKIEDSEVSTAADEVGMVRLLGLHCPLDVFRQPNEFPADSFDEVYERASENSDGSRLPDPLDLVVTKLNTGRTKDLDDSRHLEHVIRARYRTLLPSATLEEAKALLDRFLDWEVCEMALENPAEEVRAYAQSLLRELADEGDPFSQAVLDKRGIPYS